MRRFSNFLIFFLIFYDRLKCSQNGGFDRSELVVESWKTFDTQPFGQLCIKHDLVFYKIVLVHFYNIYLIVPSQKNLLSGTRKMENGFSSKENENSLRQHCLPFQYAPLCTIWDHLNKLCHGCGHKIDHLAWKPWIFTHDSSFLRILF